jgi:hypothetical protein
MKKWEALGGEEKASSWCIHSQPANQRPAAAAASSSAAAGSEAAQHKAQAVEEKKKKKKHVDSFFLFFFLFLIYPTPTTTPSEILFFFFLLLFLFFFFFFSWVYYCVIIRIGTTGRDRFRCQQHSCSQYSRKVFCLSACLCHPPHQGNERFQSTHRNYQFVCCGYKLNAAALVDAMFVVCAIIRILHDPVVYNITEIGR